MRVERTAVAGLAAVGAAALGGLVTAAATVVVVGRADVLRTIGALSDGTLLRPELYCCGMESWQLQVGRLLASSAAVAVLIAMHRQVRSPAASLALLLGASAGSAVVLTDQILLPLHGWPGAVLFDHPGIAAWWLVWLAPPTAAALLRAPRTRPRADRPDGAAARRPAPATAPGPPPRPGGAGRRGGPAPADRRARTHP